MQLGAEAICRLIPHTGNMCLLEGVERWDENEIVCIATSHRNLNNPLRAGNGLDAIAGIEYAAQAIGVLGSLKQPTTQGKPELGYLLALREVRFFVDRLDTITGLLSIRATMLRADTNSAICEFGIECEGQELVSGRATLMMDLQR